MQGFDFLFGRRCGKTRLQELVRRGCMAVTQEMKDTWNNKIATIKKAWINNQLRLSEWETGFMDSIEQQMLYRGELSMQQSICLNKIYGRVK